MDIDERVPTNLRNLVILEKIGENSGPVSPAELARQVGLSKQTVHRLCNTLLDEGFLVRAEGNKGLRPGRRARMLASGILNSSSSHIARHQVLMELAEKVGETVNFVVPEDRGMTYIDRVETDWAFRIQLPVGTHVPFHCTASGKTYLASIPKAERRRLVHVMNLEPMTENTVCDPDALLAELALIAKQGYALDREEFIEGMVAISVPVVDNSGRYTASVAFHGPVQRISIEGAVATKTLMQDAAEKLTRTIFEN
jgi:DNA-binding IclR family transcriptional regulator